MSIKLKPNDLYSSNKLDVQHLPCEINMDGHAKITTYFMPEEENGKLTSSFRGRPLEGKDTKIPDGFQGVIMECKYWDKEGKEELMPIAKFDNIVQWKIEGETGCEITSAMSNACNFWPKKVASAIHDIVD